jgi:hypothetical protein
MTATYTVPSYADFAARFGSEFSTVAQGTVEAAIADASRQVDQSWLVEDYAPAILLLAAHILITDGALTGGASNAHGPITSESRGDASYSYAQSSTDSGWLASSPYGARFARLQRVNVGGPVIV